MLGQDLVPLLRAHHDVRPCTHADCDITDQVAVSRVFAGNWANAWADGSPELVINCAAMADVDGCEREPRQALAVNARGAGNLARAAEGVGARVFHLSTDYVFDGVFNGTKPAPYTEQAAVNPLSVYGHSKLEGERMVLYAASGPSPHLIIRTSWLYGRYRTNFVDKTIENARAGKPILAVTDQVSCSTWTFDLAQKIVELADKLKDQLPHKPATGILHLVGAGECSRIEMAQETLRIAGLEGEITPTTWEKINPPAKRPAYTAMTSSRSTELGVMPLRDWREALSDYLASRLTAR